MHPSEFQSLCFQMHGKSGNGSSVDLTSLESPPGLRTCRPPRPVESLLAEDARSGKYASRRGPLKQRSVRRGNGQECQCYHSFHILQRGQEFQHCLDGRAVNH